MLPRKIKIFNVPWHIANQYELYKIPNTEWYHQVNSIRKWGKFRPTPTNVFQVAEYTPNTYDLAVLHVDQQCVDTSIGKSKLYRELNEAITDIPKIVINHGTPFWPEAFEAKDIIMKMKMMIGDNHMVANSHRALEMWNQNGPIGKTSQVIVHGLDPEEWWDLPKEPRVVTVLSPAGLDRYYNRSLLQAVKDRLKEKGLGHVWISVDWVAEGFDDYREFLGRSLLYFNPTLESPMPRSRTEAMLSGCCVLTLNNQDTERFIKHGENGIFVPNNPQVIADLIEELLYSGNYFKCVEMGQKGKETAKKEFSKERFQADWEALITKVLGL